MWRRLLDFLDRWTPWKIWRHGTALYNLERLLREYGVWTKLGALGALIVGALVTWLAALPPWERVLVGLASAVLFSLLGLIVIMAVQQLRKGGSPADPPFRELAAMPPPLMGVPLAGQTPRGKPDDLGMLDPFNPPPSELTESECRLEWSDTTSRPTLLRFVVLNTTPRSMPCVVRLIGMQRWSDLQFRFIDTDAATPYNFIVFEGMVTPEVRKAKDLVEATKTGFQVLEVKRDRTRFGSQLGRWKLELRITLGQRERTQSLEFEWTTTGLSLPKPSEPELVETHYEEGAIITAPAPGRLEIWIERKGDRWIGKLRNKEAKRIGPCLLRITDAQSFDAELGMYRDYCGFRLDLASIREIPPGDFGNDFIFARLEGPHLEISDQKLARLPWPQADTNPSHPWKLTLELSGLLPSAYPAGVKWVFNLSLIWKSAEKSLTFKAYSSGLIHD